MAINAARSKGSGLINPAPEKAYVAQMALFNLSGSAVYMNETEYDEAGRATSRELNSGSTYTISGFTSRQQVTLGLCAKPFSNPE